MGFMRYGGLSGAAFSWPDADSQISFLGLNWLAGQLCGGGGRGCMSWESLSVQWEWKEANSLGFLYHSFFPAVGVIGLYVGSSL